MPYKLNKHNMEWNFRLKKLRHVKLRGIPPNILKIFTTAWHFNLHAEKFYNSVAFQFTN